MCFLVLAISEPGFYFKPFFMGKKGKEKNIFCKLWFRWRVELNRNIMYSFCFCFLLDGAESSVLLVVRENGDKSFFASVGFHTFISKCLLFSSSNNL